MREYKRILLIVYTSVFLVIPFSVHAAPAPWGIAINTETKECAGYWAGDEFSHVPLPEGWDVYYLDFANGDATISTSIGTCTYDTEESCCQQLGYEYVSDNIGVEYNGNVVFDEIDTGMPDLTVPIILICFSCCGLGLIVCLVVFIIMVARKKKSTDNHTP